MHRLKHIFHSSTITAAADIGTKQSENTLLKSRRISVSAAVLFSATSLLMSNYSSAAIDADNTKNNRNDESKLTPLDQSNDPADLKIAAAIRSSITGDSTLSVNAQNIKVVVRQAAVTLRGPVENSAEKSRVEMLAKSTQGVARVDNQLTVKNN